MKVFNKLQLELFVKFDYSGFHLGLVLRGANRRSNREVHR